MQHRQFDSLRGYYDRRVPTPVACAVLAAAAAAAILAFQACVPDGPAGPGDGSPLGSGSGSGARPDSGTVTARLLTTGVATPDSLTLSLDGHAPVRVPASGSWTWPDLAAGAHRVEVGGLPVNCRVVGENPRTVTAVAGAEAFTSFEVDCTPPVGDLHVTVATYGDHQDRDGYRVELDGGVASERVEIDGEATFSGLAVGPHEIRLRDVDRHCDVDGGDRRDAEVSAGGLAEVEFVVVCG